MNNSFLKSRTIFSQLALAFVFLAVVATTACQSYSTGLQQSQIRAEEAATLANLRTISHAQRAYAMSKGGEYGTFSQLVAEGFLDARFDGTNPELKGYVYTMDVSEKKFSCQASPEAATEDAGRHYYVDSDGSEIRMNPARPATAEDPIIQQ